jgi:hypothetical protein
MSGSLLHSAARSDVPVLARLSRRFPFLFLSTEKIKAHSKNDFNPFDYQL